VNFGRLATGGMVVLGLLWVPFIHLISSQLYIYLQSVQAYISPPIAACFVFGILWPRLNGTGAIASLLTGFGLGALRFGMELKDRAAGGHHYTSGLPSWLVNMNFLHYAIFMFIVLLHRADCGQLALSAPQREKLAGLYFCNCISAGGRAAREFGRQPDGRKCGGTVALTLPSVWCWLPQSSDSGSTSVSGYADDLQPERYPYSG